MRLIKTDDFKVILEHTDGRRLVWDAMIYSRTRFKDIPDNELFKEINGYWSSLPADTISGIWNCYQEIYYSLADISDISVLTSTLTNQIANLYSYHDLDRVGHWVRFRERIKLPDGLKDFNDPEDDNRTIQRTYLKKDYVDLIVMTVALRLMLPIWGVYIDCIKNEVGPHFKEYVAMKLLSKSNIIVSAPMERLKLYVISSIDTDLDSTSSILNGLGTSEIPDWLLSMVVIRRITPGDIVEKEDGGSIITNIYAFVKNSLRDIDRKFGGGVKAKFEEDYGSEDDRTSRMELFKVKQEISYGPIASYSVYTENPLKMAKDIDRTIPDEYVLECLHHTADLYTHEIRLYQKTLCQWVINPVISARAIDTLNKGALLRIMAVTQALLWWWEFYELAMLVTAEPTKHDGSAIMTMESRMRIPLEYTRTLAELYPYTENLGRSKGTPKGSIVAVKSINALSREFNSGSWHVYCSDKLKQKSHLVDSSGLLQTPANILEMLARLVIRFSQ